MANLNTTATYTSSSGLTTAIVQDYYNFVSTPAFDGIRSSATVQFSAETALQNGTSGTTLSIPLFTVRAEAFAAIRLMTINVANIVFAGSAAATATLSVATAVQALPAAGLAITGPQLSPNAVPTSNSGAVSLVTAGGTGTNVLSPAQFLTTTLAATSTTPMIVKPGQAVYLKIATGGTTSSDLTVSGSLKFFLMGDALPL